MALEAGLDLELSRRRLLRCAAVGSAAAGQNEMAVLDQAVRRMLL